MATYTSCVLCGSTRIVQVAQRPDVRVLKCQDCDLSVGEYIDQTSDNARRATETLPGHFDFLAENTESSVPVVTKLLNERLSYYSTIWGNAPKHWLEIGPGNGVFSVALSDLGRTWRGVEIEPDMAKAMAKRGLDVTEADFSEIDPHSLMNSQVLSNGGFDIVFASQVFEHVPRPRDFLAKAYKALRPGGIIHLDVPNDHGLTALARKAGIGSKGYGEVVPPQHMIAYSPAAMTFALKHAGFERLQISAYRYDHRRFGLVHSHMVHSVKMRLIWSMSGFLGLGGLLVGMGQRPVA